MDDGLGWIHQHCVDSWTVALQFQQKFSLGPDLNLSGTIHLTVLGATTVFIHLGATTVFIHAHTDHMLAKHLV